MTYKYIRNYESAQVRVFCKIAAYIKLSSYLFR